MMDSKNVHVIPSSPSSNGSVTEPTDSSEKASSVPAVTSTKAKNKVSRRPCNLPLETVEYLKAWMMSPEHIAHPYPTEKEKQEIMVDTGIELKQLTNWFVNNRKRYWKPLVEAKLQKQHQNQKQESSSCAQMTTAIKNDNLFCPSLISYPTSAKAMISILPNIPVNNNFTLPFTQRSNFHKSISSESLTTAPFEDNAPVNIVESSSPQSGLDVFQLAVNYLPHTFTSTVSESSSINDECEGSATSGESISPSAESPAMMGIASQENDDFCPAEQLRITEDYSKEDSLSRNKRPIEYRDLNPRKIAKIEKTFKWCEVCANASNVNDSSLPSLDEATALFGFAK